MSVCLQIFLYGVFECVCVWNVFLCLFVCVFSSLFFRKRGGQDIRSKQCVCVCLIWRLSDVNQEQWMNEKLCDQSVFTEKSLRRVKCDGWPKHADLFFKTECNENKSLVCHLRLWSFTHLSNATLQLMGIGNTLLHKVYMLFKQGFLFINFDTLNPCRSAECTAAMWFKRLTKHLVIKKQKEKFGWPMFIF